MFCTTHAAATDPGRRLQHNEDAWFALPRDGMFGVSDGMGAQAAGGLASQVVAETLPRLLRRSLSPAESLAEQVASRELAAAIGEVSNQLRRATQARPGLRGMGATVVVVLIRGNHALVGHLGDSRAYRLRGQELQQLTTDHALRERLIDYGALTAEQAAAHRGHSLLTRFVGMPGRAIPEVSSPLEIREGDRFLLCSDGLTSMLPNDRIQSLLSHCDEPEQVCRALVAAANQAGGDDNVTVLVIDVGSRAATAKSQHGQAIV